MVALNIARIRIQTVAQQCLSSPSSHYQWIDPAGFEPLNSLNVTEAEALEQIGMFGKPKLITDEVNSQINPDERLADSFIVHP